MKRRRFDSDDDEDEVVGQPLSESNGLGSFPYASTHDRDVMRDMGLASSSSSERAPSEASQPMSSTDEHSEVRTAGAPPEGPSGDAVKKVQLHTSCCALDQDVPDALKGLLGDALLSVYTVPLEYLTTQRPVDDRLLTQYLPFKESPSVLRTLSLLKSEEDRQDVVAANRFGIAPGWRWDGVLRGTSFLT